MNLTSTELKWLRDIVANSALNMTAAELRRYKLYLAKAITAAREV